MARIYDELREHQRQCDYRYVQWIWADRTIDRTRKSQ